MSNTTILIVDDEQRMRKLVRDYMIREGYVVLEAANGRQALEIFHSDAKVSLIILDVMMPEMDGWQVCTEILKTSKVPIIMLTAKSDERDELRGFELRVDEYVTKPFSPRLSTENRWISVLRNSSSCSILWKTTGSLFPANGSSTVSGIMTTTAMPAP